jgi:tetratricopeptide (TPR) repeat protein
MRLRLAEILLRNLGLVEEAVEHYEEAARLAPRDWDIVGITFGNRAVLLGAPDRAIPLMEPFGPRAYAVLSRLHTRAGRLEEGQHFARADLAERMKRWKAEAEQREAEKKRHEQQGMPAAQSL